MVSLCSYTVCSCNRLFFHSLFLKNIFKHKFDMFFHMGKLVTTNIVSTDSTLKWFNFFFTSLHLTFPSVKCQMLQIHSIANIFLKMEGNILIPFFTREGERVLNRQNLHQWNYYTTLSCYTCTVWSSNDIL